MEILARIERRIPVEDLVIGGLDLWPPLRMAIAFTLLQRKAGKRPGKPLEVRLLTRQSWRLRRLPALRKLMREMLCTNPLQALGRYTPGRARVCFFTLEDLCAPDARSGRLKNRFLDPYFEFCSNEGLQVCMLEELSITGGLLRRRRSHLPSFVDSYPYDTPPVLVSQAFRRILRSVRHEVRGLADVSETEVLAAAQFLVARSRNLATLLKRLHLRAVFMSYYYGISHGYALVAAARLLNIPSVDVQHGCIAPLHPAYGMWTRVPDAGYNTLPSHVWCWDRSSAETIEAWGQDRNHRAVVGGNLETAQALKQEQHDREGEHAANFRDRVRRASKTILIALQPDASSTLDALPDCLGRALRQSPDDWLWLARLHPRQTTGKERNRIETWFRHWGRQNWEMDTATNEHLHSLLPHCDAIVTACSTVVQDGIGHGLRTVFWDREGRDVYSHYIEAGLASHAETDTDLLRQLKPLFRSDAVARSPYAVETNISIARNALHSILHAE